MCEYLVLHLHNFFRLAKFKVLPSPPLFPWPCLPFVLLCRTVIANGFDDGRKLLRLVTSGLGTVYWTFPSKIVQIIAFYCLKTH